MVKTLKSKVFLGAKFTPRQGGHKAHEGNRSRKRPDRREGELLRGRNTRRAAAFRCGSPRTGRCRILAESKALKAALPFCCASGSPGARPAVANAMRVTAPERVRRLREGKKPWRENPMSGTGMKQGRKVLEEVNRQEGEKPCSRKVSGEANPRQPGFQC